MTWLSIIVSLTAGIGFAVLWAWALASIDSRSRRRRQAERRAYPLHIWALIENTDVPLIELVTAVERWVDGEADQYAAPTTAELGTELTRGTTSSGIPFVFDHGVAWTRDDDGWWIQAKLAGITERLQQIDSEYDGDLLPDDLLDEWDRLVRAYEQLRTQIPRH